MISQNFPKRNAYVRLRLPTIFLSIFLVSGFVRESNAEGLNYESRAGEHFIITKTSDLATFCGISQSQHLTCEIYIQGVYDYYLVTKKKGNEFICVEAPAPSRRKIVDEFTQWALIRPEIAQKSAAESILEYLSERFPCSTNAQRS